MYLLLFLPKSSVCVFSSCLLKVGPSTCCGWAWQVTAWAGTCTGVRVLGVSFSMTGSGSPSTASRFDANWHFQIDCWKAMQSSAKQACAWAVAGGEDVLGSQMLKALLSHLIGTASVVMICGKVPPWISVYSWSPVISFSNYFYRLFMYFDICYTFMVYFWTCHWLSLGSSFKEDK